MLFSIDTPENNDNRNYNYSNHPDQSRVEYPIICDLVAHGSKAIDFGCGNGSLLQLLQQNKSVQGIGYDVSSSGVDICQKKGIKAVCDSIDKFHPELGDKEFDYAICNVTIQMVMYPEILLKEMVRISRYQIISFPNFAYISNRFDLLFNGRMPRSMLYGYSWYSTGHIHQLSLSDLKELVRNVGESNIIQQIGVPSKRFLLRNWIARLKPNLLEKVVILLLGNIDNVN
jgi:methionine biosynthesis protein MetW